MKKYSENKLRELFKNPLTMPKFRFLNDISV